MDGIDGADAAVGKSDVGVAVAIVAKSLRSSKGETGIGIEGAGIGRTHEFIGTSFVFTFSKDGAIRGIFDIVKIGGTSGVRVKATVDDMASAADVAGVVVVACVRVVRPI